MTLRLFPFCEKSLVWSELPDQPCVPVPIARMHIKALNGTFLIDDFGRQRAKPEAGATSQM